MNYYVYKIFSQTMDSRITGSGGIADSGGAGGTGGWQPDVSDFQP
jgi:hypothetical protein